MNIIRATLALLLLMTGSLAQADGQAQSTVLFVCEHGNVKSLMAASYFNELAQKRGAPFRAIARGSKPDSLSVPPLISANLKSEGFDVSSFRPSTPSGAEVEAATRVVLIQTDLPAAAQLSSASLERWDDLPAASTHYAEARKAIRARVEQLMTQLVESEP